MKVREAMVPNRECVGPTDTVASAEKVISTGKLPAVPVLDHTRPSGTLAKHEIDDRVPEGKSTGFVRVSEVMTEHGSFARPDEELEEVELRMRNQDLNTLPVLDDSGKIVGVLHRAQERADP